MLNLNVSELNALYYCVGKVRHVVKLDEERDIELSEIQDKIWGELKRKNKEDEVEELIRGMGGLF